MLVAEDESRRVLTATENGYGKRTPIAEYTRHGRGTPGHDRDPDLRAQRQGGRRRRWWTTDDEIMLITTGGVLIRTRVTQIREMGRSTQGVTLINLDEGEKLAGLETHRGSRRANGNGANGRQRRRRHGDAGDSDGNAEPATDRNAPTHARCRAIFNFSAGPAVLPEEVLEQAGDEMLDWHGTGMSRDGDEPSRQGVHVDRRRGRERTCASCSRSRPTTRCCSCRAAPRCSSRSVPMNLLRGQEQGRLREHRRVVEEGDQGGAERSATVNIAALSEDTNFTYAPKQSAWKLRPDAAYVHYLLERDHRRRRVPLDSRHRRRAARRRHVVAHPVAPARRVEVRPDLRRRAEEHRARPG